LRGYFLLFSIMKKLLLLTSLLALMIVTSCGSDESSDGPKISIVSSTLNGGNTASVFDNVSIDVRMEISFSTSLNTGNFRNALSFTRGNQEVDYDINFTNASSKANITATLEYNTAYTLTISSNSAIGTNGETLDETFQFAFTTAEDDLIRSQPPCTSGTTCVETLNLTENDHFTFYSNYPIYEENAAWEDLTDAIILIHGLNRNSDEYFSWMTSTLQGEQESESTILIAPSFKLSNEAVSGEVYWGGSNWREGENSSSALSISSFSIIDSLITQLSDQEKFPVLENIIVTGHSSGGLFSHAYGAANAMDQSSSHLNFTYVVANSQYFYYPDGQRVNESNDQLYTPSGCSVYDNWPLGFESAPTYLENLTQSELNDQFVTREIHYLLGNGSQADPTLNTTSCDATLLGSDRFTRGENMLTYMDLKFGADNHSHDKTIVQGIGHDGQQMYQSEAFKGLLNELLK